MAQDGAEVEPPTDVGGLLRAFELDGKPADFVIIVDLSGSMSDGTNPPYPAVQDAYKAFVDAIGSEDHLAVIGFSGAPDLKWNDPVPDDETRDDVQDLLPDVAGGDYTDIGGALSAAIDRLERPDANRVQVVVFLTDGQHEPDRGSLFPDDTGPEWDRLRSRVQSIEETRSVVALGAGLGANGAAGVGLMGSVFPGAQAASLPSDQLEGFFAESLEKARLAQLDPLVRTEFSDGLVVADVPEPPDLSEDVVVDVDLTSEFSHLPVDVELTGVTVRTIEGAALDARLIDPPARFRLAPGATRTVQVSVSGLDVDHGDDRRVGSFVQEVPLVVDVRGDVVVLPDEELNVLFAGLPEPNDLQPAEVTLGRQSGLSYGQVALGILLALLAAAILYFLYWNFVQVPPLVGLFDVKGADSQIDLKGKRMTIPGRKMVLPAGTSGSIEVFTKRARRRKVFVRPVDQPVEHKPRAKFAPLTEPKRLLFNDPIKLGATELRYKIASKRRKNR